MALGMLVVLAIVGAALLYYSSSSSRNASYSAAREQSYYLAEAGINNALSVLATSSASIKPQPQYAGDPNSAITSFQGGGTATWGASFDASTQVWTMKSIGSVPNPTGPSTRNVIRTLMKSAKVNSAPPYNFASLDSACDQHTLIIRSSGQLTVTNAMYVNSCNSNHDGFDIFGSGGNITAPAISVVGGWETHNGSTVTVNGVTCPLLNSNPPASPTPGCPVVGAPVIADPFAGNITAPTLGAPACTFPVYGTPVSYSPKQTLSGNITASQTTLTASGTAVLTGDVIHIENEDMLVTAGGGTTSLTVQRAYNGTTAATHNNGKEIKKTPVTGTGGTAATPAACVVQSGTVTLQPGTYYGGICIGASSCGSNVGGSCATTASPTANVTLAPGTYIIAGGGFFVCGTSTLSAPNVMIYNTQDPTNTSGAGAIDQVELNTTGSVTLGPQLSGVYKGMTIFEDPNLGVSGTVTCSSKTNYSSTPSQTQINEYDVALIYMGSSGPNGALGSISGTIYAPAYRSIVADAVSGTANLAVLSSCILIDGSTSTFAFDPGGLYGPLSVSTEWEVPS